MGGRTTWTKEEDEKLLALAEEGLTFSAIGEALGRGKNACIGRAHRLKVYISELQPKRVKQPTAPCDLWALSRKHRLLPPASPA